MPLRNGRVSRRYFLGSLATSGAAALAADGLFVEPAWLETSMHDLPVAGLPRNLEGYTIAQLSDLHLKSLGSLHQEITRLVRQHNPALLALTGDAVDAPAFVNLLPEFCTPLTSSGAKLLGIWGNREHWSRVPPDDLRAAYQAAGGRLLTNESLQLAPELIVAATDDFLCRRCILTPALQALNTPGVRILLSHSPGAFDPAPQASSTFAVILAGHTHGGQVRLGRFSPYLPPGSGRFAAGFYDTALGRLYVSRGIGTSVLPIRIACRPELAFFRLVQG